MLRARELEELARSASGERRRATRSRARGRPAGGAGSAALEKLFFKLKKAAPPSSAVTALPFLEIGEAAPATVVLACACSRSATTSSRGGSATTTRRSRAGGGRRGSCAPRWPPPGPSASRRVFSPTRRAASRPSTFRGGGRARRRARRGATAPAAADDQRRIRMEAGGLRHRHAVPGRIDAGRRRGRRPGVRGRRARTPKTGTSLAKSLGVRLPPPRSRAHRQHAHREQPVAEYAVSLRRTQADELPQGQCGGPRDALWLSCAFAGQIIGGFSVPVHRRDPPRGRAREPRRSP